MHNHEAITTIKITNISVTHKSFLLSLYNSSLSSSVLQAISGLISEYLHFTDLQIHGICNADVIFFWLCYLTIIILRINHILYINRLFLFLLNRIPLYDCTTNLSVDTHLDCFHFLPIINTTDLCTNLYVVICIYFSWINACRWDGWLT